MHLDSGLHSSFVNDGSEAHRLTYIYDKREETVEREEGKKRKKKDNSKRHTPNPRT
jgi:hypothetical protein